MTSRLCLLAALLVAPFASADGPARTLCDIARPADFEGAGRASLDTYVEDLAISRGALAGLVMRDVSLTIAAGEAKPAPGGVTAGEISCGAGGGPPYRIALYASALEGRPLAVAYNTVAHEFQHIIQVRRDRLPCGVRGEADLARYEAEARAVADSLVPPACSGAVAGATQR